ncbi:MAG: hypothetical protein A2W76_02060 [Gammaproteobacteria bacterium RIFCSPLOWO2_12_47_11]|nr:MAG: hypothetical protein A2W76_02060 [Gammaproteobacteria bacterium RIFCSPLOWO2_12_47_11]
MHDQNLLQLFIQFGLAGLVGFLLGLEREMSAKPGSHIGIRDFVFFALLGAASAFIANQYSSAWIIVAVFAGMVVLLTTQYWASHEEDIGITTEIAAVLTFLLGVLLIMEATELAIAIAILSSAIMFQKEMIQSFRTRIQTYELAAVLKFLVITFIILPVLPRQSLDTYISIGVGEVIALDAGTQQVQIAIDPEKRLSTGTEVLLFEHGWGKTGSITISSADRDTAIGTYTGKHFDYFSEGNVARVPFGIDFINIALSALKLYKLWLIVVLVSFISFIGYIMIKLIGSGAGIGLTGLVGGLVSSTVTTLSFARRSRENPRLNKSFAVAVILAASIMFPRLMVEIAVVNLTLMKSMALPMLIMGLTGLGLAGYFFIRSRRAAPEVQAMQFENPFSLKSSINFALLFAAILVVTRLATTYLGNTWLPLVAIVSGLTDADAIAFSISDAQQAGIITTEWASFNLVLGALSNTFMKLFLVFTLGHRDLFKHLLISFLVIGASGIITMIFYYDLSAMLG